MINSTPHLTKLSRANHSNIEPGVVLSYQVEQLFGSALSALAATVINSLILVAVMWPVIDHTILFVWLSLQVVVSLMRGIVVYKYRKSHFKNDAAYWYQLFLIGLSFAYLLWGSASLLLFPETDIARQVFLAFVIGGMVAGSLTTLSHVKNLIYSFISISLIPLLLRFYFSHSDLGVAMGSMLSLYFIMMFVAATRMHNYIIQNIHLHLESIERERSLQQSEHKYQTIIETATDAYFLHDLHGSFIDVNEEACRSLGYSRDELLSMTVSDVMTPSKQSASKNMLDELIKHKNVREEGIHTRKDGSSFPVELSVGLIEFNNEKLFSVSARDITERQRIDNMKNEFISTVSHELRTPLTSIRGSLGLMNGGAVGELPEQAKEMLQLACNNTERLLLLINDILDIQKIESGEINCTKSNVEVMSCIDNILLDNAIYAEQYDVKLEVTDRIDDAIVFADQDRLTQILTNLLSNAIKFSNKGGIVEVGLTKDNTDYVISITDYGRGIPEEFYDKLFEKFTQSDSSDTREKGGTGLGLSITKLLVEMHNGKIEFKSKLGSGTTFYVYLPVQKT